MLSITSKTNLNVENKGEKYKYPSILTLRMNYECCNVVLEDYINYNIDSLNFI